ncbi:helix-turn-helix transcriptional regulator [Sporolactobacillus shoreicorticis]|uniref:Helix-turn-helix domain-containing protein n=1 Tax=Sporolactobacillus shoreicorticis TaxID=1923877 RepID=A0ABW5RZE8_9BACL|nr:helix-turn-helix transcriptional regulator [Sporolactobacillus shoreicorticis]MCO7125140.1 helix-turn-helix transcriptional regulator [Sporolactobacillus shoreicorticis]
MADFKNRLKSLRIEKGITQKDLGDRLKLSESAIGMYERGERQPSIDLLRKIAEFFDVSRPYLLGDSDIRNSSDKNEMYFFDKDKWSDEEIEEARAFIEARRLMKKNKKIIK